jgi:hypothetical protein
MNPNQVSQEIMPNEMPDNIAGHKLLNVRLDSSCHFSPILSHGR